MLRTLSAAALSLALLTAPALAGQAPGPPPPPPTKNPADAPAGEYKVDERHASVIARVPHAGGTSLSTFRFNAISGTLTWDPARVENSKVTVVVDPKSIDSNPVANFPAGELAGDRFLNVAKFPEARFVSTSIQRTGPTTGRIMGNLSFMGQTRPITIEASLVGAGRGNRGFAVGFTGTTRFKRSDFGFTNMLPGIGDEIELLLDIEFNRPAS